jgi:hypothetical protein
VKEAWFSAAGLQEKKKKKRLFTKKKNCVKRKHARVLSRMATGLNLQIKKKKNSKWRLHLVFSIYILYICILSTHFRARVSEIRLDS